VVFMKGQYMFLMCIVFLFVLIALRFGTDTAIYVTAEQNLKGIYSKKMNEAILDALKKTFLISANNKSYVEKNFEDFIRYVKNSYNFSVLAVEINVPIVYANQNTTFNTTIFNSLSRSINNVSLNFSYDGSSYFFETIGDDNGVKVNFTFNVSSDSMLQINFTYYSPDKNEKTILVPIYVNRTNFIYYFKAAFINGQTEEVYDEFRG
jgi:hypothetical protein